MEYNTDMSDKYIPEEMLNKINSGWIAALVSIGLTLGLILISLYFGAFELIFSKFDFVSILIISALAFGVYKKSRFSATLLFLLFLISNIYLLISEGRIFKFIFSIIFLIFYFRAMVGTFQYHSFIKTNNATAL